MINAYESADCESGARNCGFVDVVEISNGNLGDNYYLDKLRQTGQSLIDFYETLTPLGTATRYFLG